MDSLLAIGFPTRPLSDALMGCLLGLPRQSRKSPFGERTPKFLCAPKPVHKVLASAAQGSLTSAPYPRRLAAAVRTVTSSPPRVPTATNRSPCCLPGRL